jgi:hypothetical protein
LTRIEPRATLFQIRNIFPLCSSVNSVLRLSPGFWSV